MYVYNDVAHIRNKVQSGVQRGIFLRNEFANENFTTDVIEKLYAEEGKGVFTCRKTVLGHVQQGGVPSPFDRNLATKLASKSVEWLQRQIEYNKGADGVVHCKYPDTVALLGLQKKQTVFTPIEQLAKETDFKFRLPREQWWLKLRPLLRILAKHTEMVYHREAPTTFSISREHSHTHLNEEDKDSDVIALG